MPAPEGARLAALHRGLMGAAAFLTCVPVRGAACDRAAIADSLPFFPVVGLGLGLCVAAAAQLLIRWWPPSLVGVAVVAVLAGLTGGLHLDGVADVFDALGGAHGDRARALEIMRDSRIGAHGAVALILVLAAKAVGVGELAARGDVRLLILAPAAARWAVLPLLVYFPSARAGGLGKLYSDAGTSRAVVLATVVLALVLAAGRGSGTGSTLAALLVTLAFGVWLRGRWGGLTGDAYGAAIELAEVGFLVCAAARG